MKKVLVLVIASFVVSCAHECPPSPPEVVQEKVIPPSEEMCKPWIDPVKIEKVNCLEQLNLLKTKSQVPAKK